MTEKHSYEIIVLDLDGTLTNRDKVITPKTKQRLMELQERGKKIVLASGRPTPGVLPLAESWSWQNTAVIFCRLMEAGSRTAKPARSYSAVPCRRRRIRRLYAWPRRNRWGF